MLKISNKHSTILSLVIAAIFLVLCIAGCFYVPFLVRLFVNIDRLIRPNAPMPQSGATVLTVAFYAILFICLIVSILLLLLLLRVRRNSVFSKLSVSLIRGISWCCFLFAFCFAVVGLYFVLAYTIVVATVFLGICIRVVKNVIEQAIEIKNENDLTV